MVFLLKVVVRMLVLLLRVIVLLVKMGWMILLMLKVVFWGCLVVILLLSFIIDVKCVVIENFFLVVMSVGVILKIVYVRFWCVDVMFGVGS